MSTLFSVIVVCLNPGEKLTQTMDTILRQNCQDYEVIIKDGGSTDRSMEHMMDAMRYGYGESALQRVHVFTEKDRSIYDAMNQAIAHAGGQYLIFMNCGDYFYDENVLTRFREAIDQADAHTPHIFYGNRYHEITKSIEYSPSRITPLVCYRNIPCHQTCFYSRSCFDTHLYQTKYKVRADYEHFLWCYFQGGASFTYVPTCVAKYEGGGYSDIHEKRSMEEHKEITGIYMTKKQRLQSKAFLILTLQPLRHAIATNPKLADSYNKLVRMIRHQGTNAILPFASLLLTGMAAASMLSGCAGRETPGVESESNFVFSPKQELVDVMIPGMQGEQILYLLADLHIAQDSDQVAQKDDAAGRVAMFSDAGRTSLETWQEWVDYLQEEKNPILFAGDMVDFASEANVNALAEGLDTLQAPIYYVRADHDVMPFYLGDVSQETALSYQQELMPYEEISYADFGDFVLMNWNDSTTNLSAAGLEAANAVLDMGKPVILLTHVPLNSQVDDSLANQSAEVFGDRVLLWGPQCYYWPDENTAAFLNRIYAQDSSVVEVLSGHLHFEWDGQVTPQIHQHVFGPAFSQNMGVIRVHGEISE